MEVILQCVSQNIELCVVDGRTVIYTHVVDYSFDKSDEGSPSHATGDELSAQPT